MSAPNITDWRSSMKFAHFGFSASGHDSASLKPRVSRQKATVFFMSFVVNPIEIGYWFVPSHAVMDSLRIRSRPGDLDSVRPFPRRQGNRQGKPGMILPDRHREGPSLLLPALFLALLPASSDPPGFLVVAPAAWESTLAPFLEARRHEFRVEFAPLEEALAGATGADPPERLKRHLYRAWKERGVRFVLLVGDADTLPVRFMVLDRVTAPAFDTAFYASDLYYADLADEAGDFDSWNASSEGFRARYFGEVRGEKNKEGPINADRVSYRPEIALGRCPVPDAASLAALVARTSPWSPPGSPARAL